MPQSIITYDKQLPEIPDRRPWEKPVCFLVKDLKEATGWREDKSGRRPSRLLLVEKLRATVDQWRADNYPGASEVTRRLFEFWFEEDHEVSGYPIPFHYHFCQREAIEVLAYLYEISEIRDTKLLIQTFAKIFAQDLLSQNIEFQETMDGTRQVVRYVAEIEKPGAQDLPPEDLRRYAFKMATGSGKTWVMAMVIVWSHFHRKWVKGSTLSDNFLIVAPNVIVYQRLEKDLASNRLFHELPLIPPEWKGAWNQKVILRGESAEPDPSCNLFLTNIQQLYESRDQPWTPENAVEALLGPSPTKDLSSHERSMLDRLKSLKDLVVLNDEAHHVHDEDLSWHKSLMAINRALPNGLALWLDFSATPKDQGGMYYPWIICDYPLAQAVEDRIVKAPIIVTKEDDKKQPNDPDGITKENVTDKYAYWIHAAVKRWRDHYRTYKRLGTNPVLFIMAEKSVFADAIGEYLCRTSEFEFKESEVLVIHTDTEGEITKADLEKARMAARDIDKPANRIKAIVSVMMLREGWDVRSVSVVLGLRPFTAQAEILPEQVIGRGLRLMTGIGPDRTQTLEVLGTRNLLNVLRNQLEAEGVGVTSSKADPPRPIIIEAIKDRQSFDIAIPITKPRLVHNFKKLSTLAPETLAPIYDQTELKESYRISLKMEFGITETEVHHEDISSGFLPTSQDLLGAITNKVIQRARLASAFAELYPLVRCYVTKRCFGQEADLDKEIIRSHLNRFEIQEGIAKYLARKISEITLESKPIEFEKKHFRLSQTKAFSWRRNLPPPLVCKRTIFNYIATYNNFERQFAIFLDAAADVLRFASLGTTEQGDSGTQFRVDYLKVSGAIGLYHPDWVVVQETDEGEVNWIIETKGREWEGTTAKDASITDWCTRISTQTGHEWRFARINQKDFYFDEVSSFHNLLTLTSTCATTPTMPAILDFEGPEDTPTVKTAPKKKMAAAIEPDSRDEQTGVLEKDFDSGGVAVPSPVPPTTPSECCNARQFQAVVFSYTCSGGEGFTQLTKAFIKGYQRINFRIGFPDDYWINSLAPFPEDQLPPSEDGHSLTVVFIEPHLQSNPLVECIHLPAKGNSTIGGFQIYLTDSPPDLIDNTVVLPAGSRFEGRFLVFYKNRLLITYTLEGDVFNDPADVPDNSRILLRPEVKVDPFLLNLDIQGTSEGVLLFNHSKKGEPSVTKFANGKVIRVRLGEQAIREATEQINQKLSSADWGSNEFKDLNSKGTHDLLLSLACHGHDLYEALVMDHPVDKNLLAASHLQVIAALPESRLPVEFCYQYPAPAPQAILCPKSKEALTTGKCISCSQIPNNDILCPLGFWGLNRVLEWHLYSDRQEDLNGDDYWICQQQAKREKLMPLVSGLVAVSQNTDANVKGSASKLTKAAKRLLKSMAVASSWPDWINKVALFSPTLLILVPHTDADAEFVTLEIGGDSLRVNQIDAKYVCSEKKPTLPLVFLLGCETGVKGIAIERAITKFRRYGASIIVSTSAPVLGRHATLVATRILEKLKPLSCIPDNTFGDVMLAVRRELLAEGLAVILAVSAYGDADWRFR